MVRTLNFLANIFPVWVVALSGMALMHPTMFDWFKPYIVPGLGVIMLGMGITLSVDDFRGVLKMPRPIAVGFAGQFMIMPFLGWGNRSRHESSDGIRRGTDSCLLLSGRHGVERGDLHRPRQSPAVAADDHVLDLWRDRFDPAVDQGAGRTVGPGRRRRSFQKHGAGCAGADRCRADLKSKFSQIGERHPSNRAAGVGDADVLSASSLDDKIAWYENQGGGTFGQQQIITTAADGAQSVYATDLDGDGDADVLSASYLDDKIAWYENQGGGTFGQQQIITTAADGARSVYAIDLDGDGDADVLSASVLDDKIAWYENQGGGTFGTAADHHDGCRRCVFGLRDRPGRRRGRRCPLRFASTTRSLGMRT